MAPDDYDARFSLAHKYSELRNDDLALYHYLRIPIVARGVGAWNNLGVQYDSADISAKAVEAYRKAQELNNTLAMSNLAVKLLGAGFLSEAKQICDEALKLENVHPNVSDTLAKVAALPDSENKLESACIERARPKSELFRRFGKAASRTTPKKLPNQWRGPTGALSIAIQDSDFRASGKYEVKNSLLALTMAGQDVPPTKYVIKFRGKIQGRAIHGSVVRKKEGEREVPATILSIDDDSTPVLLILSDDLSEIEVTESPQSQNSKTYTLRVVPST